jgi:hypothetical protein
MVDVPPLPSNDPAVIAHINLLQGIINRLAGNSASCKTWCLTLVGALLSLAGATHVPGIATFALVPVVIFGFVDTMYLAQEKAYRRLYNSMVDLIRANAFKQENLFEARAPLEFCDFFCGLGSWSIFPIYLTLIGAYVLAAAEGWLVVLTK